MIKGAGIQSGLKSCYCAGLREAGCDEAGRGCLAGPVFAAAVILPEGFTHPLLTDSKKLTEKQRIRLKPEIEAAAVHWATGTASAGEIDEINILNASILAMHRALDKINIMPEHIIVDGNRFRQYKSVPHKTIIRGDSEYYSIAAASVLAKTERDDFMKKISKEYPAYNWSGNKGYPTKEHRAAIREHGITPYHRRTFRLMDDQMKLPF